MTPNASPTVHPRACGEQPCVLYSFPLRVGSSPRLRGTVNAAMSANPIGRFIPAPAGNRAMLRSAPTRNTVHPRACGEQLILRSFKSGQIGSSPRLRGTASFATFRPGSYRFIPAPAGNSWVYRHWPSRKTVHPRACGEQLGMPTQAVTENGSSPRLRGTDAPKQTRKGKNRFIPATAGNSC